MDQQFFNQNPVFQNMSPDKISFLMNFANSKKPATMKEMAPFLLGTINQAKKQNKHNDHGTRTTCSSSRYC